MWEAKYLALDYLPDPLQLHQKLYDVQPEPEMLLLKRVESAWSADTHSVLSNLVVTQYAQ